MLTLTNVLDTYTNLFLLNQTHDHTYRDLNGKQARTLILVLIKCVDVALIIKCRLGICDGTVYVR